MADFKRVCEKMKEHVYSLNDDQETRIKKYKIVLTNLEQASKTLKWHEKMQMELYLTVQTSPKK